MTFKLPIVILSITVSAHAAPLDVSCIGSPKAKHKIIYLHGLDTTPPSAGERNTQEHLAALASEMDLRIASPHSKYPCPAAAIARFGSSYCWEPSTATERAQMIHDILQSSHECLGDREKFGVMGFSTGGNLVNQWMLFSEDYRALPLWFIPIAISRQYKLTDSIQSYVESHHPKVTFVVEKRSPPPAHPLFEILEKWGIKKDVIEFQGGHFFDPVSVKTAIQHRIDD